jgi:hypothetical protein
LLQRLLSTSSQLNHAPWWELVHPLPLPEQRSGFTRLGPKCGRCIRLMRSRRTRRSC